jgi:hypothetical protein
MWRPDPTAFIRPDSQRLPTSEPEARDLRRPEVRLNLPATHVPLFHAWKP